jgi:hypothetical protein
MTREELLGWAREVTGSGKRFPRLLAVGHAILRECGDARPESAATNDGWRTDKPPTQGTYLVTLKTGVVHGGAVWVGGWHLLMSAEGWRALPAGDVLAWRPLPSPYRSQTSPLAGGTLIESRRVPPRLDAALERLRLADAATEPPAADGAAVGGDVSGFDLPVEQEECRKWLSLARRALRSPRYIPEDAIRALMGAVEHIDRRLRALEDRR